MYNVSVIDSVAGPISYRNIPLQWLKKDKMSNIIAEELSDERVSIVIVVLVTMVTVM